MITQIGDYADKGCGRCARFDTDDCAGHLWESGLRAVRDLCLEAGLVEAVKWGHLCYASAGRNIALIGATRAGIRHNFFHAAFMRDPAGVLHKQRPNTRHADMIALTNVDDIVRLAPVISSYLAEAIGYADAGLTPPKDTTPPELPDELVNALDDDPILAEAIGAPTPGRQNSYFILVNGTKAPQTRFARITMARDRIVAGKGAQER